MILPPPPFPEMTMTTNWVWPPLYIIDDTLFANYAVILLLLIIIWLVYNNLKKSFTFPLKAAKDTPSPPSDPNSNDKLVHLYLFQGFKNAVSFSPFSSKLALYCRWTGIPHTTQAADFTSNPKGKVPYARHANQLIPDSQFIISYLEKTFDVRKMAQDVTKKNKNLKKSFVCYDDLCPADKALCDFVRYTCEGDLYWSVCSIRWLGKAGLTEKESSWQTTVNLYFAETPSFLRQIITSLARVMLANSATGQGFARHSPGDQLILAKRAVNALSSTLGNKEFFLGDFPTEADAMAFGTLQGLVDNSTWRNPLSEYLIREAPNLVKYTHRIKNNFFADMKETDKFPPSLPNTDGAILLSSKKKDR